MFGEEVLPVFFLGCGTAEPVTEMHLTEADAITGDKAFVIHRYTEVARVNVGNDLPRVPRRTKELPNQFVLPDLVRPGHFDHAISRLSKSDICDRGGDIVRNHG